MKVLKRWTPLLAGVWALIVILAACTPGMNGIEEPGDLPAAAVLEAQQWLADELGVTTADIEIVESEQVDWSDACLGLGGPEEACAAVVTPGWRVELEVNGETYELRTNEDGTQIRMAE